MNNIWYLNLEPVKNRYTEQLSKYWIPKAFQLVTDKNLIQLNGQNHKEEEIKKGVVFDATGRNLYALDQIQNFLIALQQGIVTNGDVVYIQDMWTPGIEAIFYTAHIYNLELRYYATCWAQSFDEYDFTYDMRKWLHHYEMMYSEMMDGIFVANTMLKDLMIRDGIKCPIHVTSLPFDPSEVKNRIGNKKIKKEKVVIYASRFDWEKNPFFMLEVADKFLEQNKDWQWWLSTSNSKIRSNQNGVKDLIEKLIDKYPNRFLTCINKTKNDYYEKLTRASIVFNSALQDWVSFTILEGTTLDCEICYPRFRSFPEFISSNRMYVPGDTHSAVDLLNHLTTQNNTYHWMGEQSWLGTLLLADIVSNGADKEHNIWLESSAIMQKFSKEIL